MTDDDPTPADLSPEAEAEVARLLADAGGPATPPPEVLARLDEVLAGLVADRAAGDLALDSGTTPDPDEREGPGGATLTPLAVRRRRWPRALLAAAAVVVVGYGLGGALRGVGSGAGDASSGASSGVAEDRAVPGGGSGSKSALRDDLLRGAGKPLMRLSSDDFDAGVLRAVREGSAGEDGSGQGGSQTQRTKEQSDNETSSGANGSKVELRGAARGRCAVPPVRGRDRWAVVRYDEKLATLVVRPAPAGAVRARVFSCDGTTLLRDEEVRRAGRNSIAPTGPGAPP